MGDAMAAPAGKDAWKSEQRDGVVRVSWNGRPLLAYQSAPVAGPPGTPPLLTRSGYIHPLHAPNGAVVTDDFSDSHPHQRGVFFAWTKTRIVLDGEELHPDFWNLGSGTARVRSRAVSPAELRSEGMLLRAQHAWEVRHRDAWREALDEEWEILARPPAFADPDAPAAAFVVDITSRQTPRFDLDLPQYIYGGMAVRAARQWGQKASLPRVLTSEGKDRVDSDASTARWVDMRGQVEGRECGVALLEHAANPRAPNALRVHPDVPYYVFSLPKTASVRLLAGTTHTFRYRVVAHNGGLSPAGIDTLWQEMSGTQA
jgi:hypothetical protein